MPQNFVNNSLNKLKQGVDPLEVLNEYTANLIENLMGAERNLHLKSNKDDKANGYYKRLIPFNNEILEIDVPRDRDSDFRPQILPDPYKRDFDNHYDSIINALIRNGYSKNSLATTLNTFNLSYSEAQISDLVEDVYQNSQSHFESSIPTTSLLSMSMVIMSISKMTKANLSNLLYTVLSLLILTAKKMLSLFGLLMVLKILTNGKSFSPLL